MPDQPAKDSVRKGLLKRRDSIPPVVKRVKDRLILESLLSLDELKDVNTIFLFASFRSEVDTLELLRILLSDGRRVVLPKVERENKGLLLYEIKTIDELSPGYMGIPEPSVCSDDRLTDVNSADVVIIPGAGFDADGNRIGYGGGYYDRLLCTLEKAIPVIAPAYEEQILEFIPSEPHDRKVSIIVTDRRIIRPASPDYS
ncbi:MAG: 5-formyltetrahydrofolate cyclo-ligase [Nitrospirae bacterium]|nr:5-formyltetrahydrofolate cyclo-ligase [Nitrospirota bacterium]